MAHVVLSGMIERGGIINIASIKGVIAVPNMVAYTVAKSEIADLTCSMAVKGTQFNMRANVIASGYTRTDLMEKLFQNLERSRWVMSWIPMKRLAEPENDLGYVAVFLASETSAYINRQVIYVDGGWLPS